MKERDYWFYFRVLIYFLLPTLIGAVSYIIVTVTIGINEKTLFYNGLVSFLITSPLLLLIIRYEKLSLKFKYKIGLKTWLLLISIVILLIVFVIQILQINNYINSTDFFRDSFLHKFRKPLNIPEYSVSSLQLFNKLVFVPIIEEITFTYILFRILLRKFKLINALFLTAFLFGIIHLPYSFFPQFCASLMACYLFYKVENILIPIFLHSGYNFVVHLVMANNLVFSTHLLIHIILLAMVIGIIVLLVNKIVTISTG